MLEESLRRRLETLNRDRLPAATRTIAKPSKPIATTTTSRGVKPTGDLLSSAVVCENSSGEHLLIPIPVDQLWPGGEKLVASRLEHLQSLDETSDFVRAMPREAILLDLETCGFSGSALFLVGLLREIDDRLTVELLLARTYAEEQAVLVSLWQRLAAAELLVTYNGKSFDWPMVIDRSHRYLLHKTQALTAPPHLDALHLARRRWKGQLPDCKLQTIERLICRRARVGDIPGSQIPAAYDAYVRTGVTHEIEAILHHNALDLVTLLDIAMRLA